MVKKALFWREYRWASEQTTAKNRANYRENSMKRGAAVLMSLIAGAGLAACDSKPSSTAPITPTISVSYVEGNPPGVAVAATHAQPLRSAELVGPNNTVLSSASAVEREAPARRGSFGLPIDLGVGIFGGSGGGIGTGVGVGVPLGGGEPTDPNRYRARIPINDSQTYKQTWQQTTVRLRFGQEADGLTSETPAPPPR
jgi:hypothetical protein